MAFDYDKYLNKYDSYINKYDNLLNKYDSYTNTSTSSNKAFNSGRVNADSVSLLTKALRKKKVINR